MLSRQAFSSAARSARSLLRPQPQPLTHIPRAQFSASRCRRAEKADEALDDPEMNNNYINPPAIKRQHRDPYFQWDDPQERRNFGEPVHEDNDVLGMFSLEDYTHFSPARGLVLWAGFIAGIFGVYSFASWQYPGKPSAPKEYEAGLDRELGGAGAVRAHTAGDEITET